MRTCALSIVILAGVAAAGCSSHERPEWASINPTEWANRSISDAPIAFDLAGPVAVNIQSFNGDVRVIASEEFEYGEVMVKREATHGFRRTEEAKLSLEQIQYSADVVDGVDGPVLQIRTWTAHAEPHFQRTHITVNLPAVRGLTVQTSRGNVTAIDVQGPIDVNTTEGDVRVMSNWPITEQVSITNRDGDIDYRIRGESTGDFDLVAINGRAMHRATHGRMFLRPVSSEKLRAILNGGENPVVLRTENGDVRVAVVPNPTDVGRFIFDP